LENIRLEDQEENGQITLWWILGGTGCEDGRWMGLAQGHVQWWASVSVMPNLRVLLSKS
jgi:hypothetical protein